MQRLTLLIQEGEIKSPLFNWEKHKGESPLMSEGSTAWVSDPAKQGHLPEQGSGSQTVSETKPELPKPSFWLHPLASLSTEALCILSRARRNALRCCQRQGIQSTWALTLRDAGGRHPPDVPEVSKTGMLTAPKGIGYPIPLFLSSTQHDKLLENPVKPSPPSHTSYSPPKLK